MLYKQRRDFGAWGMLITHGTQLREHRISKANISVTRMGYNAYFIGKLKVIQLFDACPIL